MARKIVHQLVDDIDGSVLEPGDGETVRFSLEGVSYEIDVTDDNAAALRGTFTRFIDAGRSVSAAPSGGGSRTATKSKSSGETRDLGAVREWARSEGHEVSERGRIAGSVLEAYDAAH